MKNRWLVYGVVALALSGVGRAVAQSAEPLRVLIFSGQNNHDWSETTPRLKAILETGGHFKVDITRHPEECDAIVLAEYDALLSDWNAFGDPAVTHWPAPLREAFLEFVRAGKGFVTVHAGSSSFFDWLDYQQLAGAAWGSRTSHGTMHTNVIRISTSTHPVTTGLVDFQTFDEFWQDAEVAPGVMPLAEVTPKQEFGGSGKPEPIAFATEFGRGRGFTLLLGHDTRSMQSVGFQELLRCGTEWAATGRVKLTETKPLWNRVADPAQGKPYFHPLTTAEGTTLTALRPVDHPWHRGLWWSWKFINGLNYWEEDRQTGLSQGRTEILTNRIRRTLTGAAEIDTILGYHPPDREKLLMETRSIRITEPDAAGNYFMDWTSEFVASGQTVQFGRTPPAGEEGGEAWGGYAGLSARLDAGLRDGVFMNSEGRTGVAATHGVPARWMDYGSADGGLTLFDHPHNLRHPTPWYVDQKMPFFSPALLFRAPYRLQSGRTLKLRYRILVHSQPMTQAELEAIWQDFSRDESNSNPHRITMP